MVKTMVGGVSKNKADDSQRQANTKSDIIDTPKKTSPPRSPVKNKDSLKVLTSDVWNCDKCNKKSDDTSAGTQWIECDLCEAKFHHKCVGISVKDYKVIDKFPTENLKWFCDNCVSSKTSAEMLNSSNTTSSVSSSDNNNTQETIKILASFVQNNTNSLSIYLFFK